MMSRSLVLRVLGAVLSGIGGVASATVPLGLLFPYDSAAVAFIAALMLAGLSGWLLRSWWALLAVPGLFLGGLVVANWFQWYQWVAAVAPGTAWLGMSVFLWFFADNWRFLLAVYAVPLVIGAAIGIAAARALPRRADRDHRSPWPLFGADAGGRSASAR